MSDKKMPWEMDNGLDSVAQQTIDDEIKKIENEIGVKENTDSKPFGENLDFKAFDDIPQGIEIKYKDKTYTKGQKGRKPKWIDEFISGSLSDTEHISYGYPSDNKSHNGLQVSDSTGQVIDQAKWKASEGLVKSLGQGLSGLYDMTRNNPLHEKEIDMMVVMCTPLMYKYYDQMQYQEEITAIICLGGIHMKHRTPISYETGKPCSLEQFEEEKLRRNQE